MNDNNEKDNKIEGDFSDSDSTSNSLKIKKKQIHKDDSNSFSSDIDNKNSDSQISTDAFEEFSTDPSQNYPSSEEMVLKLQKARQNIENSSKWININMETKTFLHPIYILFCLKIFKI